MCQVNRCVNWWRWTMVMLGLVLLLSGCGFGGSTPTPTPEQPTSAPPRRTITILSPTTDATVTSPIVVTGDVTIMPFEANLNYRLFGPGGGLLAEGFFTAEALGEDLGGPGVFAGEIPYTLEQGGPGRIEVLEFSMADGSTMAIASVSVNLSPSNGATGEGEPTPEPQAQALTIDSPPPGTTVGSPVTIAGRTTVPPAGNSLTFVMRDAAGTIIGNGVFPVSVTAEGQGSFTASIGFNLPLEGGAVTLEVLEPGAPGAPAVASTQLTMVVAPPQAIVIESPPPGTTVGSPVTLTGRTARFPFQGNLLYRVFDAAGRDLGNGFFPVLGAEGGPAIFNASVTFNLPVTGGRITIEIADQNASTNEIIASARLDLNVAPQAQAIIIESPPAGTTVGSPMTIAGRTVQLPPNSQLTFRVRDVNGQQLGTGQFGVSGSQEGGGRFNSQIFFNLPPGGGSINLEVLELDPNTGQVMTSVTLPLNVAGPPTPTATPAPTATPVPPPTRQAITIETPPTGTTVGSPVVITGRVALYPQFRELYYVVRTLTRETLGQGSFPVAGQAGQVNVPFAASLNFTEPVQGGTIAVEIYDRDGAGQIIASAIVQLQVNPRAQPPTPTSIGPAGDQQVISVTSPVTDTVVGSPAIFDGTTALAPFQNRLVYTVTDAAGNELGKGELSVREVPGIGFVFSGPVLFTLPPAGGEITVRLADQNDRMLVPFAETSIRLVIAPPPQPRAP